jgi:cytochrome c553
MKKTAYIFVFVLFAIFITGLSALSQDGEELYSYKFCITCHGQQGISVAPNYPNLANQNESYLVNQMKDIIEKRRSNKLTILMTEHPVVSGINDEEMSAIAAHMTKIKKAP